jgi:hypothetical protein
VIRSPFRRPIRQALVNGNTVPVEDGSQVVIRRLPAEVSLTY